MDVGGGWGRMEVRRMRVVAARVRRGAGGRRCLRTRFDQLRFRDGGRPGGASSPDGMPAGRRAAAHSGAHHPGRLGRGPSAGLDGFRVTDGFSVGTDDSFFVGSRVRAPTEPRAAHTSSAGTTDSGRTSHPSAVDERQLSARASVHGTGPTDVSAVSGDQIFHRDAQGWSRFADEGWRNQLRLPLPFSPQLDPYAYAPEARTTSGSPPPATCSAGTAPAWTVYNFDDPTYPDAGASAGYNYNDFWIDGPNDVWIAGDLDGVGSTMEPGIVHHFDGTSFTQDWRSRLQRFRPLARWTGVVVGGQ